MSRGPPPFPPGRSRGEHGRRARHLPFLPTPPPLSLTPPLPAPPPPAPPHFRIHAELLHTLRTGQPAVEKVMGKPVFEVFASDPAFSKIFNDAMTSMSALAIPAALDAFDFGGIRVLVDV